MSEQDVQTQEESPDRPDLVLPDAHSTDPRIGKTVDKYRIVRLLGRGGMGSVYEAQHVVLGRRFAIKFMLPEFASQRDVLRRFENEAKAAGSLEHQNIAAVTDLGHAEDGAPYLVMEYLSGYDCATLLTRHGPLPVARATDIVHQACLGLAAAHQASIVHRDIKPENLFVTQTSDGRDLVKILDFGIAKLRNPDASAATGSGVAMGTFYYMAPEQIRDSGKVDGRADVWALGVVLYELLTGRRPFEAADATGILYKIVFDAHDPPGKYHPELPQRLSELIDSTLAKSPDDRIASVMGLADAIVPFTARQSHHPQPLALALGLSHPGTTDRATRATTSQASIATLTKPLVTSIPIHAGRSILGLPTLAGIAVMVTGLIWFIAHRTTPLLEPGARNEMAPTVASPAPSGTQANAQTSVDKSMPRASAYSAFDSDPPQGSANTQSSSSPVRTSSERTAPRSNKVAATPASEERIAPRMAPASRSAETPPPNPNPTPHNPVSIDTNSPY